MLKKLTFNVCGLHIIALNYPHEYLGATKKIFEFAETAKDGKSIELVFEGETPTGEEES